VRTSSGAEDAFRAVDFVGNKQLVRSKGKDVHMHIVEGLSCVT
jgi:hypothetical protein